MEVAQFQTQANQILFIPPAMVQVIKLLDNDANVILDSLGTETKKLILMAVNDHGAVGAGGQHWSLLVYSSDERSFYSFDSLNNGNKTATSMLVASLKKALKCPSAAIVTVACLQQNNYYDCGIHLLANAEAICRHFVETGVVSSCPPLERRDVVNKRQDYLAIVRRLTERDAEPKANAAHSKRKIDVYTPVLYYREKAGANWSELT